VGGAQVALEAAPYFDERVNRVYVPVRAVSEALGRRVEWDGASQTVYIRDEAGYQATRATLESLLAQAVGALAEGDEAPEVGRRRRVDTLAYGKYTLAVDGLSDSFLGLYGISPEMHASYRSEQQRDPASGVSYAKTDLSFGDASYASSRHTEAIEIGRLRYEKPQGGEWRETASAGSSYVDSGAGVDSGLSELAGVTGAVLNDWPDLFFLADALSPSGGAMPPIARRLLDLLAMGMASAPAEGGGQVIAGEIPGACLDAVLDAPVALAGMFYELDGLSYALGGAKASVSVDAGGRADALELGAALTIGFRSVPDPSGSGGAAAAGAAAQTVQVDARFQVAARTSTTYLPEGEPVELPAGYAEEAARAKTAAGLG